MNVGALSAYKQPGIATHNVCWNQQSDRPIPSVSHASVPSGSTSMAVSHKGNNLGYCGRGYTQTASRPGAMTPGGIGCDIKHNSYARYLNRIKAKGPLKQQGVPINFGGELPFNRAFPIYGGKTMKTGIVNGCNCDIKNITGTESLLYKDSGTFNELYPNINLSLSVGNYVYALLPGSVTSCYARAIVESINDDGSFNILFDNGITDIQTLSQMRIYYPCPQLTTSEADLFVDGFLNGILNVFNENCIYPNNPLLQELLA